MKYKIVIELTLEELLGSIRKSGEDHDDLSINAKWDMYHKIDNLINLLKERKLKIK